MTPVLNWLCRSLDRHQFRAVSMPTHAVRVYQCRFCPRVRVVQVAMVRPEWQGTEVWA